MIFISRITEINNRISCNYFFNLITCIIINQKKACPTFLSQTRFINVEKTTLIRRKKKQTVRIFKIAIDKYQKNVKFSLKARFLTGLKNLIPFRPISQSFFSCVDWFDYKSGKKVQRQTNSLVPETRNRVSQTENSDCKKKRGKNQVGNSFMSFDVAFFFGTALRGIFPWSTQSPDIGKNSLDRAVSKLSQLPFSPFSSHVLFLFEPHLSPRRRKFILIF